MIQKTEQSGAAHRQRTRDDRKRGEKDEHGEHDAGHGVGEVVPLAGGAHLRMAVRAIRRAHKREGPIS